MRFMLWLRCLFVLIAAVAQSSVAPPESPTPATGKAAVDQLIPWLLDKDLQLRGVAFSNLIFDATRRKVLPFAANNAVDQRVANAISAACDETMQRLNAPNSEVQNVDRINEISSHFEDPPGAAQRDSRFAVRFPTHGPGQGPTFRLSGFAHHRSGEQTRVLFGPEASRCRTSRQQFSDVLFRAKKIDQ